MDWKADAEEALTTLRDVTPVLLGDVPQLAPFMPLLAIALKGVTIVQQATGGTTTEAVAAVAQTLTPGMSDAPALSRTAFPSSAATTAVTAAGKAAEAKSLDEATAHATAALTALAAG